ncbi:MAG: SDR family oxidoreductase [Bacteroidota bacterium]
MSTQKDIAILGCGWLGLPLAEALISDGWTVKGATTRSEKLALLRQKGIQAYQVKVEPNGIQAIPNDFFHTSTLVINIPPRRKRKEVERLHVLEIQQLIKAATAGGIKHILFVSSTSVYGNINSPINEDHPTAPATASGRALVRIEQLLQEQSAFQCTILRLSGLVGGDRKAGRFFAGRSDIPGGNVPVNMIHQKDAVGIIQAILTQEKWGYVLNASADQHPLKKDFYPAQAQKVGLAPPSFLDDQQDYKIITNDRVKSLLHYTFQYPDPMEF